MQNQIPWVLIFVTHSLLSAFCTSALAAGPPHSRVVVRTAPAAPTGSIQTLTQRLSTLSVIASGQAKYRYSIKPDTHVLSFSRVLSEQELERTLASIRQDQQVLDVQPDVWMTPTAAPNDPLYSKQWHYFEDRAGIGAEDAWTISRGSHSVVVAVIDTGIVAHVDISPRLVPGYDFVSDTSVSGDGDGWDADETDPGDPCDDQGSSWHGTHVAGTIGATTDNSIGVSGINWRSRIQPIRALGLCGGFGTDIAVAIRWAAGLKVEGVPTNPTPAKVINLSLGAPGACDAIVQDAITAATSAGAVLIVSAGNENEDLTSDPQSPATCNNVITVAAIDRYGRKTTYSNYGASVDISAPGGTTSVKDDPNGVYSLSNSGTSAPIADTYKSQEGTSMAAPHVAGVASLLLSVKDDLTPAQIESYLKSSSRNFVPDSDCTTTFCGSGMLDAPEALALVEGNLVSDHPEFNLGRVQRNTGQFTHRIELRNTHASDPVTFGELSLQGSSSFSITEDGCSYETLSPSERCTVQLRFSSTLVGAHHAVLDLPNNLGGRNKVPAFAEVTYNENEIVQMLKQEAVIGNLCILEETLASTAFQDSLHDLRYIRDSILASSLLGRVLIQLYYLISDRLIARTNSASELDHSLSSGHPFRALHHNSWIHRKQQDGN